MSCGAQLGLSAYAVVSDSAVEDSRVSKAPCGVLLTSMITLTSYDEAGMETHSELCFVGVFFHYVEFSSGLTMQN